MNPEVIKNSIQAIIDGLTPLAQKLQVPIEGLWGWAIKHNYALATAYLIEPVINIAALIVGLSCLRKANWEGNGNSYAVVVVVAGVIWLMSGMFLLIDITEIIARFVSPEWMTIQDIARLIKNQ